MKNPVIMLGMGEMGGVFARAFLRAGYPVFPVTRDMDVNNVAREVAQPEMVVIAVAEGDLRPVLERLPAAWRDRVVLLQNELLPSDWMQYGLEPTVISVWFEKKKGSDAKVLIPSPVYGRWARQIVDALASIDIATKTLADEDALQHQCTGRSAPVRLARKYGLQLETLHRISEAVQA